MIKSKKPDTEFYAKILLSNQVFKYFSGSDMILDYVKILGLNEGSE